MNFVAPCIAHKESMSQKIKILTLSDHPLSPSGVGTQTKYFITSLLDTGKFSFYSLGGAIKHNDYNIIKTEEYKDDWIIQPVDGYGTQETIRSILRFYKPDILWFMTDPRFYGWLWDIENEIRSLVPMVYYHVWDNFPYPQYNQVWYESTDYVATISKLTSDIVRNVDPSTSEAYIPHAIPSDMFTVRPKEDVKRFRRDILKLNDENFCVFWNNRNARRKQSGSLIFWFKEFLDKLEKEHGHRNSTLVMHTDPRDGNGQDLYAIANHLGLIEGRNLLFSAEKIGPEQLSYFYNSADVSISTSDAEGFGLFTFESMACGTPIIATLTGGLQEQVLDLSTITYTDIKKRQTDLQGKCLETPYGIGMEPASKAIIGSQQVPYIYEDRLSQQQVVEALMRMYEYGDDKRTELGKNCREKILKDYSFENFKKSWEELMLEVHEKCGSWETRKNYKAWELIKV